MEGSTGRLDVAALLQEVEVLQLVAVEVAAHVDALAPEENKGQLASDATRAPLEAFRVICEEMQEQGTNRFRNTDDLCGEDWQPPNAEQVDKNP